MFLVNVSSNVSFYFYWTPSPTKFKVGHIGFTLSVRVSVCGRDHVRSVSSTILGGCISYLWIFSCNCRSCVSYLEFCKIPRFESFASFFKISLQLLTWNERDPISVVWAGGGGGGDNVGIIGLSWRRPGMATLFTSLGLLRSPVDSPRKEPLP